ncbi:hypothetical protein Poly30_10070 [Planctomycetes bacterium Poly30]|uniref:Alkyl hydroperoxide reductase subunit C/ Thiol specific antioxidant domain-containing protein n=1 Tax=Saltatorellus ferox TaxID=2528018 RepID=A0A518EN54_9BACT|nr:hypothetical protein Poly30_10070 [Planctomycetes bacterium Poly30]
MIQSILTLGLASGALLMGSAPAQGVAEAGEKPSYSFREAPLNSMGIKSLSELRGRPVLVEFWGTQ